MSSREIVTYMQKRAEIERWMSLYDRAYRLGPADIRSCGCTHDPAVFGHFCGRKRAFSGAKECTDCDL